MVHLKTSNGDPVIPAERLALLRFLEVFFVWLQMVFSDVSDPAMFFLMITFPPIMVPWTTSPLNSILPFIAIFYFHDGKKRVSKPVRSFQLPQLWYHPQNPFGIRRWPTPPEVAELSAPISPPQKSVPLLGPRRKKNRMVPINPTIWFTWNPNDPCFDWKRPCFGGLFRQNWGQRGSRWLVVHCQNAKNLRLPLPAYEESMVWYLLCVLVGFVLGAGSVGGSLVEFSCCFFWVNFAAWKLSKTMMKW